MTEPTTPTAPNDLTGRITAAFERGAADRARAQAAIARTLASCREAVERSGLGLSVEGTDFDGLFLRARPKAPVGWWAYLVVDTHPEGMVYTVRAGFGRKNEAEGLKDRLPDRRLDSLDAGLAALEEAIVAGAYYLGSLRRP